MNPLKLGCHSQTARFLSIGISLVSCLLLLAPTIAAKTESVDKLIKQLRNKHADVRASAAELLGKSHDPRAVDPLIEALKDPDADVRTNAVNALGNFGDPHSIEALALSLNSNISHLKDDAARALIKLGTPAVGALISVLNAPDSGGRIYAAWALGIIKDPAAVEPLIAALKDTNVDLKLNAAAALGSVNDQRAVEPLINALKDTNADVRMNSAAALGRLKDARAVEPLIGLFKDANFGVVQKAARALVDIGPPAVDLLLVALNDANASVRVYAVDTLSVIGDPRSVEPIISLLKDPDANVRVHAALALGQIADPRTVEPLKSALKDADQNVRMMAGASLAKRGITAETNRDGRFIAFNNGTVLDTKTNLMWAARDNGEDIDYEHAVPFCANFRAGGYSDWRMPYPDELAGLYDASKSQKAPRGDNQVDIHVATGLIQLTHVDIFAAIRPEPGLIGVIGIPVFAFQTGKSDSVFMCGLSCGRALPVRSTDPKQMKNIPAGSQPLIFEPKL